MKIISAILGFIVKLIAGSFVWLVIALVACFPLGLLVLKLSEGFIKSSTLFQRGIQDVDALLYALFTLTCFAGIVLARVVAVSIKILADKKLAQRSQKS